MASYYTITSEYWHSLLAHEQFYANNNIISLSDQQVDGETLLLLICSGSIEQLKICGFKTIKDQLTLKKVISEDDGSNLKKINSIRPTGEAKPSSSKLTLSEMKCMSAEEKRLYLSTFVP